MPGGIARSSRAARLAFVLLWCGSPAVHAQDSLGLRDAVEQTLAANLDLATQQAQLDADRAQIDIARSALLPTVGIGAQGQILDDDRTDGSRGNVTQKSATVFAGVEQVLYDDEAWAGYSIQKHVYASQEKQFESYRLDVISGAAAAFLQLELAEATLKVQRTNRDLTQKNIDTARARVATGYSGERDVLRWQGQLASNETAIVQAKTQALVNRFELNRVRNLEREAPVRVAKSTLDEYGFAWARPSIADALEPDRGARTLRDFMVRVGVKRSPVLAALNASIEAEERQLTASRRAFWLPSLSLGAGVDYLAAKESSEGSSSTTNDTEWGVKAALSFPLFEGGSKFAVLRQSRSTVSSLRTERRAQQQSIEESIRTAFAQASGAYASLGFAREAVKVSRRNFDLVNESYVAGVSSILNLIDAQTQLLQAEIGAVNAYYGFLEELVAAEAAVAFFPFLEPGSEVAAMLDQLQFELGRGT